MTKPTLIQGMRHYPANRSARSAGKRGLAFVVEALILLAFLAGSVAVFMQLFGAASVRGVAAAELDDAVIVAENVAERFAADPSAVPAETQEGVYTVYCNVSRETRPAGTLYLAVVTVADDQDQSIYTLETSRYVSGSRAGVR